MMVEKREKGVELDDTYDEEEERSVQLRTTETLLRLLPVGLCVAALVIMIKNSQTSDFGHISYSTLGAFTYLVHANGICAGYSLISAVVSAIPRPSTMSRAWTFFLLDQILTYAILAAGAASTELLFLSYHGDDAAGWSAACLNFGMFCRKARTSIVITLVVMVVYIAISFLSSYRLFSKYAPPVGAQSSKEINTANI